MRPPIIIGRWQRQQRGKATGVPGAPGVAPTVTVNPVAATPIHVGEVASYTQSTVTGTSPFTRSFRWQIDAANVGTQNVAYTPVVGDIGAGRLRVVETITNAYGSATGTSAAIEVLAAAVTPVSDWNGVYGANADAGETDDPTVDATPFSALASYTVGQMVSSGGVYYIAEADLAPGSTLTNPLQWYTVNQIMYLDSSTGVDSNRAVGTVAATQKADPFRTLNAVFKRCFMTSGVTLFSAGALVLLKRGQSYDGNIRFQSAACYVGAWGSGARPIVRWRDNNGDVQAPISSWYRSGWRIRNLFIDGDSCFRLNLASSSGFVVGATITGTSSGATALLVDHATSTRMTIKNITGTFAAGENITGSTGGSGTTYASSSSLLHDIPGVFSTANDWKVLNCEFTRCAGNGVSIGFANNTGTADNVRIQNVTVSGCGLRDGQNGAGLGGGAPTVQTGYTTRIINCSVFDNGSAPIGSTRYHQIYMTTGQHYEISGCKIYCTTAKGNLGIVAHGAQDTVWVHHNDIFNVNNGIQFASGGYGSQEYFTNLRIEKNKIHGCGTLSGQNQGFPFDFDSTTNSYFVNNLIYDNTLSGSIVDKRGVNTTVTDSFKIWHNTFYNTPGVVLSGASMGTLDIRNNVFVSADAADVFLTKPTAVPNASVTLTHNLVDVAATNFVSWNSTGYSSWAALTSAVAGKGTNSLDADPLFTNAGTGDFSISGVSPCLLAGAALGETYDFAENLRHATTPSIGAYET